MVHLVAFLQHQASFDEYVARSSKTEAQNIWASYGYHSIPPVSQVLGGGIAASALSVSSVVSQNSPQYDDLDEQNQAMIDNVSNLNYDESGTVIVDDDE